MGSSNHIKVIRVEGCEMCPYMSGWDPDDCPGWNVTSNVQSRDTELPQEAAYCKYGRGAYPWHGGDHDPNDKKIGCFDRSSIIWGKRGGKRIPFPDWCPLKDGE